MARPIDVVRRLCPHAKPSYVAAFENGDALFQQHGITTPLRLAHFLAQAFHETDGLTIEYESGAYSAQRLLEVFGVGHHSAGITAYEAQQLAYKPQAIFERVYGLGNPDKARELGNTQPGDGYRYRGTGIMQTTGRDNFRRMGQKCGVDFENHPELVLSSAHALKPALAEWTEGHLNDYADKDDVLAISRGINLGNPHSTHTPNGMASRRSWLAKIKPLILTVDLRPGAVVEEKIPEKVPVVAKKPISKAKKTAAAGVVVATGAATAQAVQSGVPVQTIVMVLIGLIAVAAIGYFVYRRTKS